MGEDTEVPGLNGRPLRLLCLLGTRPEAVKVVPIVLAARQRPDVEVRLVTSGQHPPDLLNVLAHFNTPPDGKLRAFRRNQSLAGLHAEATRGFAAEIEAWQPDVVVVQGDTTSALAGALAAFYARVPVAHVEAGLRTRDLLQPYPEEMNRRLIDSFAEFLFPPTQSAADNLAVEDLRGAEIFVTGNTVVDSLLAVTADQTPIPPDGPIVSAFLEQNGYRGRVLVTVHRRESWGKTMDALAGAVARVAKADPHMLFLAPLHPNPTVRQSFNRRLPPNVIVGDPLPYSTFCKILGGCDAVITDSGGVTEEAVSLGKPVVVLRECTERPEAINADGGVIGGVEPRAVEAAIRNMLAELGAGASRSVGVFGDGLAGERIVDWLRWRFGKTTRRPKPFCFEAPASKRRTRKRQPLSLAASAAIVDGGQIEQAAG